MGIKGKCGLCYGIGCVESEGVRIIEKVQAKDTVISKLKETIHSLRENVNPAKVKKDIDEIKTINIELEHSVAKLLSENEKITKEKDTSLKNDYGAQLGRPKEPKSVGSSSKSKNIESRISNQLEPTQTGEFTISNVPSSSLIDYSLEGVDLLTGSWGINLYTLSIGDMMKFPPICLLSKASKTKCTQNNQIVYLHVFGALCYPTNDSEDLGKLKAKADVGIFIGYAPAKKAYQIKTMYSRFIETSIMETFDVA
ncbi:hypothetical protein Tco_0194871 [Tanacetum coccineum]